VVPEERAPIWIADYAWRAAYGPAPVEIGIQRCEKLLELVAGRRAAEASVGAAQSQLEAMRGNVDEARALIQHWRDALKDVGSELGLALTSQSAAWVELVAGEVTMAEDEARQGCDALERMGETGFLSSAFALLAESLYRQGRLDEAFRTTEDSEHATGIDDLDAQIRWRGTRAKVLARRDDLEEAERLAREAVALVETTEWLNLRGDTRMDLGEVLCLAGRRAEASHAISQAVHLYEQKGNVVSAKRARSLFASAYITR
jgi:ATP/maltotriose-dependent transcriptional regulator MalT